MTPALPLAVASRRLRRPPGRPRKRPVGPADGHSAGTAASGSRMNGGPERGAVALSASAPSPRLVDVAGAAAYLSVSVWTVRDLIAAGQLARVRLEVAGRELRRVLVDRADLDALITEGKR